MNQDILVQKIAEINNKVERLKEDVENETNEDLQKKAPEIISELEELRDSIQKQYTHLNLKEKLGKRRITEIEKNIYNSISSFESAFSKAGSIFKIH